MRSRFLLLFVLTSGLLPTDAWAQVAAPKAEDKKISALYRAREEWKVTTTLTLTATDEDGDAGGKGAWSFEVMNPAALKTPSGTSRLNCFDPTKKTWSGPNVKITAPQLSIICEYEPPISFSGEDKFQYRVSDSAPSPGVSPPATVTVDVKSQGLRWEFTTGAGQVLSSDTPQNGTQGIPDIFGKTAQDFMLRLDWVVRDPKRRVTPAPTRAVPDSPTGWAQSDMHVAIHTGLVTRSEAATATPVTDADGNPVAGAPSEPATASRRKFTAGADFTYNFVLPSYATGAFVEIGGLARGNLDATVETDDTFEEVAGRIVKLARTGEGVGAFRAELGGRVTLKQYHEEMFQMKRQLGPGQSMEYARNSDDLVTVEFGYQRDGSLASGDSGPIRQNRYFVRALFTVFEIPGTPGHLKPLIGVELNGAPQQPTQVKLLYGANLSAIGAALGLR